MKNNLEIYQIDSKNYKVIKIFKDAYEAAKQLCVSSDNIFIALSNRTWKYKGCYWLYSNDYYLKIILNK